MRAWLAANVETAARHRRPGRGGRLGPRAGRPSWPAAGWVGINWPAEYGGRGASPVEVAIFNTEYARSGAPQLVNRVGHQPGRPDTAGPRDPRAVPAVAARHHHRRGDLVPALQRARGRLGPAGSARRRAGRDRRRLARHGPEGVDLVRAVRPLRAVPGPHRPGVARARGACRSWWSTWRPPASTSARSCRSRARPSSTRSSSTTSSSPTTNCVGPAGQGWAVASTTLAHERGTNFPFKEEVVHEGYLTRLFAEAAAQRHARRSRRRRRPGRRLRVAGGAAHPQLAHPVEAWPRAIEPGPESSWVKLTWSDMTQHLSQTALAVLGRRGAAVGAAGNGSGCGARRPASPAGPPRSSAT